MVESYLENSNQIFLSGLFTMTLKRIFKLCVLFGCLIPKQSIAEVIKTADLLLGVENYLPQKLWGVSPGLRYDIHITEKFAIGFLLNYRHFSHNFRQVGYGTLLSHWYTIDNDWSWSLEYGLLASSSVKRENKYSALAHDTRLAAGFCYRQWGALLGYHISTLRQFDVPAENQNRMAFTAQFRFWEPKSQTVSK